MYEEYTDKQIVEMLEPKLKKLGYGILYPETAKLMATIYRSGYIRGQLGRSFIIGEKKIKEKWEYFNKNNVKVGSKVRAKKAKSNGYKYGFVKDIYYNGKGEKRIRVDSYGEPFAFADCVKPVRLEVLVCE